MNAPPVQYATTRDGYSIAYAVSGGGDETLVVCPAPFNNLRQQWASLSHRPRLEALAQRFRLVQYDGRGEGMSQRGLPEQMRLEHYELDLEAVIERCCPGPVVLYGQVMTAPVVVRYAARRPEKVRGLVLYQVNLDDVLEGVRYLGDLARDSWQNFLMIPAFNFYKLDPQPQALQMVGESMDQEDFFKLLRMPPESLRPLLPLVKAPTLILAARGAYGPRFTGEEEGKRVAALMPDARLIVRDSFDNDQPALIAEFVDALPRQATFDSTGLSPREVEVLRLVAAGKSNQEIADDLVISLNTVNRHVSNIYAKTGAANRAQAAVFARDHGLV